MPRSALTLLFSLVLVAGTGASALSAPARPSGPVVVTTDNETPVLYDDDEGGNASGDDPAIWVHPDDSDDSVVIVTAKEGGLRVYDLDGQELQSLAATPAPQHDAVAGATTTSTSPTGCRSAVSGPTSPSCPTATTTPCASSRSTPAARPRHRRSPRSPRPSQAYLFQPDREGVDSEHTAYGLAVYQPRRGPAYVVVTQEGTTAIATAQLVVDGRRRRLHRSRTSTCPASSHCRTARPGCRARSPVCCPSSRGSASTRQPVRSTPRRRTSGLWRIKLPLGSGAPRLVDRTTDFGVHDTYDEATEECVPDDPTTPGTAGSWLTADAEGVDVYYGRGGQGYVIVSSQGDDTFVVYARQGNNRVVGSFRVAGDEAAGVDDVNGSDGLAAHQPSGRGVPHRAPGQPRRAGDGPGCGRGARRHQLLLRLVG